METGTEIINYSDLLTTINYKFDLLLTLLIIFILMILCRYVYKFFNLFF